MDLIVKSLFSFAFFMPCAIVHAALNPAEMAQHLEAGKPILGSFTNPNTLPTKWMSTIPDSTPIAAMNIPGTHDTCTWNYTGPSESVYRTQDRSVFDQLNAGIRFLDIRFGLHEDTNVLRVYHADTLLSATASLEDVLWGLYYFLEHHPTETLLVSLKVDHGNNSLFVQETAHQLITASPVSNYWLQSTTLPENLQAARGKIILFRRFGFDTVNNNNPELTPVGLDVSSGWSDNVADFSIAYSPGDIAYIEDLYQLNGDAVDISPAMKVQEKFNAIVSHVTHSQATGNTTQVFISFASGYGFGIGDVITPKILAEGNDNATLRLEGINQKMDHWLAMKAKQRLGIVLYDFYESQPTLVQRTIGYTPFN